MIRVELSEEKVAEIASIVMRESGLRVGAEVSDEESLHQTITRVLKRELREASGLHY